MLVQNTPHMDMPLIFDTRNLLRDPESKTAGFCLAVFDCHVVAGAGLARSVRPSGYEWLPVTADFRATGYVF